MKHSFDGKDYTETDELLRAAVGCALDHAEFKSALHAFRTILPEVAPNLLARMPPDEDAQRALAFAMMRGIWSRVPRPDDGWRARPETKPERNAPCPCGSGRKFKQCCDALSGLPPFGEEGLSLLSYVLERFPAAQYKTLPFNRLSPEELGHVASQWLEQGRHKEAEALLAPLFADPAKLDARHEYAFDMLCDAHFELGHSEKRLQLVERMMHAPDRALKASAMHRRCTMLADKGDYATAWKLFKEAQRVDPDNPSLAHLEVIMLIGEDHIERAQERARFWAVRLKKLGYGGEEIVGLMEQIAQDPSSFAKAVMRGSLEDAAAADAQSLAQAQKRAPRIAKMLTAKKPRMPELQPGLMSLGGKDEAWFYRQSWRGLWESSGALDWLRQVSGGKA